MIQSYVGTNIWPTHQVPCQTLSLDTILQRQLLCTMEAKRFYETGACGHENFTENTLQFEKVTERESRVQFYCMFSVWQVRFKLYIKKVLVVSLALFVCSRRCTGQLEC